MTGSVFAYTACSISNNIDADFCCCLILSLQTDKRFAVKARLSGILPIVVGLIKKYQEDQAKLLISLKLLQSLASNGNFIDCPARL